MTDTRRRRADKEAWGPDDSFRAFGEHVISERIQRLLSYVKGVRRGTDPEAVHDMRVASRRLRAALDMFEPAFQHPEYERLCKAIKQVTDSLSRARDLDVMIIELGREAEATPPAQRGAVAEIVRSCATERRQLQGNVVAALDRLLERDPAAAFAQIAAAVAPPADGAAPPASEPSQGKEPKSSARRATRSAKKSSAAESESLANVVSLPEQEEPQA